MNNKVFSSCLIHPPHYKILKRIRCPGSMGSQFVREELAALRMLHVDILSYDEEKFKEGN